MELILISKPNCKPCEAWKRALFKYKIDYVEVSPEAKTNLDKIGRDVQIYITRNYKKFKYFPAILVNKRLVDSNVNCKITYLDRLKEWGLVK